MSGAGFTDRARRHVLDGVGVPAELVALLSPLLASAPAWLRDRGEPVPPELYGLLEAWAAVAYRERARRAGSDSGSGLVPTQVPTLGDPVGGGDDAGDETWISTAEAGRVLHTSDRWIRRVAGELGGRQSAPGSPWRFPRSVVEAHARRRTSRRHEADTAAPTHGDTAHAC